MPTRNAGDMKGLLFICADVDENYRTELQKWHNCEHIRERVTTPGFHVGRRYQGIGNSPDFLMIYETYDARVLSSEPYLRAKNNPTPWTKEVISHFSNNRRNIYSLIAKEGGEPTPDAPYLFVCRFNIKSESRREVIEWNSEKYLPAICTTQGVYRGRLYEVDTEVSDIITAESKISGSKPNLQKFLATYEIGSLALPKSKTWQEASEKKTFKKENLIKKLEDVQEELYWLDFVMYAHECE